MKQWRHNVDAMHDAYPRAHTVSDNKIHSSPYLNNQERHNDGDFTILLVLLQLEPLPKS